MNLAEYRNLRDLVKLVWRNVSNTGVDCHHGTSFYPYIDRTEFGFNLFGRAEHRFRVAHVCSDYKRLATSRFDLPLSAFENIAAHAR